MAMFLTLFKCCPQLPAMVIATALLSGFDYKTAEQLVSEERSDDLLRYIASIEAGAAG